ncbi:hypothetical protein RBS60_10310 [Sinomonas sp. ASV486]|uniref:hypothetical protein n=1 Tax=Sinomonas sp. ASV486 TaxID=3051170 RepID=UPI0027DD0349|nr:hypothetical protein [Sinomonas sp. ASV486]MDQ4490594.1 hypothetical protein [Sinomonas sp. ASV486]
MEHRMSGRWAAVAATAGGAAHLAMVPAGGWMAILAGAMAAACTPCAWHLWRGPSLRAGHAVIAMSVAMALVHAVLAFGGAHGGGHAHGAQAALSGGPGDGHATTMLAVIAVELLTAFAAAAWVRRQRLTRGAVVR